MPRSPRFPVPDRPDPEARLLAAVAERDSIQACRLADQLVHRRGVAAVRDLLAGRLLQQQGPEAGQWLAARVGLDLAQGLAAIPFAEGPTPEIPGRAIPFTEISRTETPLTRPSLAEPSPASATPWESLVWETSWIDDLAREESALAQLSAASREALVSSPAPQPEPLGPTPLIPRLMAVSQRPQPRQAPAPAPASLARLRAWLHDDDQLAEAS